MDFEEHDRTDALAHGADGWELLCARRAGADQDTTAARRPLSVREQKVCQLRDAHVIHTVSESYEEHLFQSTGRFE
jgi:hypothetical protein